MIAPAAHRRFFAEEIQAVANLTSPSLIEALATIERERYLPAGPWVIRSEGDFGGPPRLTPSADGRHVCHNVAVAIDEARTLYNGAPGVVAMAIEALRICPGERVVHIGTGLGYYTAILAHCVGPSGRIVGIEVDPVLARRAADRFADRPWVDIQQGDASGLVGSFDAMLVSAGVTHPLAAWLDALSAAGRIIVPLTAAFGPSPIGKGPMVLLSRRASAAALDARVAGFVAIYSAVGLRDEGINVRLGQALARSPFAAVKSFRRDPHEPDPSCWLHTVHGCLSLAD